MVGNEACGGIGVGDEGLASLVARVGLEPSRNYNVGHGFESRVNGLSGTSLVLRNGDATEGSKATFWIVRKGFETIPGTIGRTVV